MTTLEHAPVVVYTDVDDTDPTPGTRLLEEHGFEPPRAGHPLLGRQDVVLTPHIAYFSQRTEIEYVRIQAQNAVSLLEHGAPDSPVNRPAGA